MRLAVDKKRRPVENVQTVKGGLALCTLFFETAASMSKSGWDAGFSASVIVGRMGEDKRKCRCTLGTVQLVGPCDLFSAQNLRILSPPFMPAFLKLGREDLEWRWTCWFLHASFGTTGTVEFRLVPRSS